MANLCSFKTRTRKHLKNKNYISPITIKNGGINKTYYKVNTILLKELKKSYHTDIYDNRIALDIVLYLHNKYRKFFNFRYSVEESEYLKKLQKEYRFMFNVKIMKDDNGNKIFTLFLNDEWFESYGRNENTLKFNVNNVLDDTENLLAKRFNQKEWNSMTVYERNAAMKGECK